MSKVTVHVYGMSIPLPEPQVGGAYCYDRGGGLSEIHIPYYDDDTDAGGYDPYIFNAYLSHELGHAYHNWCECFSHTVINAQYAPFWEKQISENDTTFNPALTPWKNPTTGQMQHPHEQFANAFRCFFGGNLTRGVSGAGSKDPVAPGFEDPGQRPGWCTQLKLLPETCALIKSYGIKPNTLSWIGGDMGGWQFQITSGHWVCHWFNNTNLAEWYYWDGSKWVRWYPSYNRS